MRLRSACVAMLSLALAAVAPSASAGGPPTRADTSSRCPGGDAVRVPGAERQVVTCLSDLTTSALTGTRFTDPADWTGLTAKATRNPIGVAGTQIDGYFPDTSTFNTTHGWNHDAQFVIRLPEKWNGGLVITGAPGTRKQYSVDVAISDYVLARGYAFASTDKGNNGSNFYTDGKRPGDAVVEWNERTTQLTRAAKRTVAQAYGHAPAHTYVTGGSNGGYLTRWQLENHPELYDGGVDWEGSLITADADNMFGPLVTGTRYGLALATKKQMHEAGFPQATEFLWSAAAGSWGLTQKIYRAEFDPTYDRLCPGRWVSGTPSKIQLPCLSDIGYDYAHRPKAVHDAIGRVSLTGDIGKPMLTIHGDLDVLLPITRDSDVYTRMVHERGRDALHRYYKVEGATHVDGAYDSFPDRLRPLLPCYRGAFDVLTAWVEHGKQPPPSETLSRPSSGDVVNTCPGMEPTPAK